MGAFVLGFAQILTVAYIAPQWQMVVVFLAKKSKARASRAKMHVIHTTLCQYILGKTRGTISSPKIKVSRANHPHWHIRWGAYQHDTSAPLLANPRHLFCHSKPYVSTDVV